MNRLRIVGFCLSVLVALASAAGQTTAPDPWPGYVAGGQYFRNVDWGVTFWGPSQANQQLETTKPGVLVYYSMPAAKGRPGWVVTALANRVTEELPGEELLKGAANQLRRALGNRLTDVKVMPAEPSSASPLAVGRVLCTVAPDRASAAVGPIHKHYLYLRIRPKQYLTFLAEGTPSAADTVAGVVDALAKSVSITDPQSESAQVAEATQRTAKLLAAMQPSDWTDLAAASKPQWLRILAGPAGPEPAEDPPGGRDRKPETVGWMYSSTTGRGGQPGQIESVTSVRVGGPTRDSGRSVAPTQGDTTLSAYTIASIDLVNGEETIRQWIRTVNKTGAGDGPAHAIETFITARRKRADRAEGTAAGASGFEVTVRATGKADKNYQAQIPGLPYLPAALTDLWLAKLANQRGLMFGAFHFVDGEVAFQTVQPIAPAAVHPPGGKAPAIGFLIRPRATQPLAVRWTTADGQRALREMTSPQAWMDAAVEGDVPPELRRELPASPNWP